MRTRMCGSLRQRLRLSGVSMMTTASTAETVTTSAGELSGAEIRRGLSLPLQPTRCSSGTTFTSTRRWRRSSPRCSSPKENATKPRCWPASPPTRPDSWCEPFARLVFRAHHRRSGGRRVHLPRHHHGDGSGDRGGRDVADLRQRGDVVADDPRAAAPLAQGLALGGGTEGAATYVAEHAPDNKRGLHTSWIQTTATLGFFISLVVIGALPSWNMAEESFKTWGWADPVPPLARLCWSSRSTSVSSWTSRRYSLQMKALGKGEQGAAARSFTNWANLKIVLIALFGAAAGQGVI